MIKEYPCIKNVYIISQVCFQIKISDIFYIRTIQIITSIWVTWTAITEKSPVWPVIWVHHCRRHISLGCRPYWGSNRPPNPLSPLQHPPQWNDGPSWGCSRFLYWGPGIPQVPHQCVENLCPSVDYACGGCPVFPGEWRTRYPPCLFFHQQQYPVDFCLAGLGLDCHFCCWTLLWFPWSWFFSVFPSWLGYGVCRIFDLENKILYSYDIFSQTINNQLHTSCIKVI